MVCAGRGYVWLSLWVQRVGGKQGEQLVLGVRAARKITAQQSAIGTVYSRPDHCRSTFGGACTRFSCEFNSGAGLTVE
jgi:hypothetical protein